MPFTLLPGLRPCPVCASPSAFPMRPRRPTRFTRRPHRAVLLVAVVLAACNNGIDRVTLPFVPTPVAVAGGHTFTVVSVQSSACALTTTAAAYCWGPNTAGEVGDGTTDTTPAPVAVAGGLRFATVSVGWSFTCGITTGGLAYCWGAIPSGDFTVRRVSPTPVPVPGGLNFTAISAGAYFACGVAIGGAAYCWGANDRGQLGNGTTTASATPVAVVGGLSFTTVSTGAFGYACGITTSNAAFCWGDNLYGELGIDSATGPQRCNGGVCGMTPVAVAGGLSFATLSAGYATACGVTTSGAAYCWGASVIDLGHYQWTSSATPVAVAGGLTFATISAGSGSRCGVTTSHAAYCWGDNGDGELGIGTEIAQFTPQAVVGGLSFTSVSVGQGATIAFPEPGGVACGVTTVGAAYCWGKNTGGQLGTGGIGRPAQPSVP